MAVQSELTPVAIPSRELMKAKLIGGLVSIATWGGLFALVDLSVPLWSAGLYGLVLAASLLYVRRGTEQRVKQVAWVNVVLVQVHVIVVTLSLGGLVESGAFPVWGFISPLGALVFLGWKAGVGAAFAFTLGVALCGSGLITWDGQPHIPAELLAMSTAANIVGAGLLNGVALVYALRRLRMEQHARERIQLETLKAQKIQAIGTLAAGIAHDFNNILMAFVGNVSLAKRALPEDAQAHSLLQRAERALDHATGLTRQLLAFSQGGAPIREVASLADMIKDSATFVLHGSKCACEFDVPANLWSVEADLSQLSQVIQNLVLNASQAMAAGGTVRIECANIEAGGGVPELDQTRKYVTIRIIDQGAGIRAEMLGRIFEPYVTGRPGGMGLGLATSHAIVRSHEGHIAVHSDAGKGSTFMVFIPATDKRCPHLLTTTPSMSLIKGRRVLVMDDEPAVREVLEEMLLGLGCVPTTTADGTQAVLAYQSGMQSGTPFSLVILDLTVKGGMGGVETVQHLLRMDSAAKVLASSGYVNDDILTQHKRHGFFSVLRKPYRLEVLRAALADAFRGSSQS